MKKYIYITVLVLWTLHTPAQIINKVEYFIDTDPGFGNGINVTITASSNIPDLLIPVNITGLSKGFHNVYLRSRDNNGWSLTNRWLFVKDVVATNVNKLEYFVDSDPGFGNGIDVSISQSGNIADVLIPVDITSLSKGFHNIYLRSKDDGGSWSLTNRWLFVKDVVATAVNKLEYFIDTDPGFGNGTNVTVSSSANITDVLIPLDMSSLSTGFHNIYLRSKDEKGSWSLTNRWLFFKDIFKNNVQAGEYFFDTDPGFGNGTPIPFSGSLGTDVADFSFAANAGVLTTNGTHNLFIRTKEANGKWSLTNVFPFTYSGPVPVELISFKVVAEGKKAHLSWQTASEQNSDRFEILRSADGLHFEKIGSVKAAGNSSVMLDYSFYDLTPKKGLNYYRLKEVDIDNSFEYSEIKTAQFGDEVIFSLYNSITSGEDIKVRTGIYPSTLSVFDAAGKKVREARITSNHYTLSVNGLAAGTYIAVLNKDGKVLGVEKFLKR